MATMTLMGLYDYDDTIFDNMVWPFENDPSEDDKNLFIEECCLETAELELIYPDPVFMKRAIGLWSSMNKFEWQRMLALMNAEYNPIENYDRIEETTITDDGSNTNSGTDSTTDTTTVTNSGTDTITNKVTGYDSNTLATRDSSDNLHGHVQTNSGGVSMTHGHKVDLDNTRTIEGEIHGNIGVTTTQQMMEQEINIIPKINILRIMVDSFKNRFCVLVY